MFGMTHHVERIINIWSPCKREVTLATSRCKIELREANSANSRAGGQPLSAGFRALPAIRQPVNDARNSHGLRCQVPADVD